MPDFADQLIRWYGKHKRSFPWRNTRDPYLIWVSEIVLQQTRVEQGLPYYHRFISSFPDIRSLATAPEDAVMKVWQGLGYYSRARNMMKAARMVVDELDGCFPSDYHQLLRLPGTGKYTAAAVSSFSAGQAHPVIDGNVTRFIARLEGITGNIIQAGNKRRIERSACRRISRKDPGTYNQAIMEFGAMICRPVKPLCLKCPFSENCKAYINGNADRIPYKPGKKELKKRFIHYLVIFSRGKGPVKVLMNKRKENDIWKNLYDFPSVESDRLLDIDNLRKVRSCESVLNGSGCTYLRSTEAFHHILSHRELIVKFFLFETEELFPGEYIPVPSEEIMRYPVPRLIEKFFQKMEFPWVVAGQIES